MNGSGKNKAFKIVMIAAGIGCVGFALLTLDVRKLDFIAVALFVIAIFFSSRITIPIPRFKSRISPSDLFVFVALLLYGGQFAVLLAASEAFFASLHFCNKKVTSLVNASSMALSTTLVFAALNIFGLYSAPQMHGSNGHFADFVIVLCTLALIQFIANTAVTATYESLNTDTPVFLVWRKNYLWSFLTYFVGAASSGVIVQMSDTLGFGVLLATLPVILFVFLTYKTYYANIAVSLQQTQEANEAARKLEERSAALRESEHRFRSAFTHAPIGIAIVSPMGKWLKVNKEMSKILGYSHEQFLSKDFQSMVHPHDLPATLSIIREIADGKRESGEMEKRYINSKGDTVWTTWGVSAAGDVRTEYSNLIFQVQDITDKKVVNERLLHAATHDPLTGLPNRSFFMERLSAALVRSRSNKDHKISILFIDLDRFKNVNDSLGHHLGDKLLIAIAERLNECVRPGDLIARLGGDEFTVLVEGDFDYDEVQNIAKRINRKFGTAFELDGHEIYSSASIGILNALDSHESAEEMMRDADTAMYQAKRGGKARHEIFTETMHHEVRETLRLETDLRNAIKQNEFAVVYQPIYSLATGDMQGLEALARWHHPTLGDLPPRRFIELAEEIGVIDELAAQIMQKACSEIGQLIEDNNIGEGFRLGINLSSRQFGHRKLIHTIENILLETEFPAENLNLEITESAFFEHQDRAIKMLHRLRKLGVTIDIDDFGTGYSNLGCLVRLPINALKIDRSFIQPSKDDKSNTEIVRTIVAMAKSLGLKVVAVGAETEEQVEKLRAMNCDAVQGFALSKPMNLEQTRNFVERNTGQINPVSQFENIEMVPTVQ